MQPSAKKSFDVLGLGCAAVDDFVYVPAYPAADSKARVEKWHRQCGGLTGNALVAAARLGARCAFAGCLGTDELSDCVANNFLSEGVDVSHSPRFPEGGVVHSTIVVAQDTGSRNVFYEVRGVMGAHPSQPSESVIGEACVLFIDHYGMPGNLRAIKCARRLGVPVVADIEDAAVPLFEEVLNEVDHLILSEEFACPLTQKKSAAAAAQALWRPNRAAAIVTCGSNGCWSVSQTSDGIARHHPTFKVPATNTSGCGDVFHGAYAYRLACGDSLEDRICFASAAAAVKAQQPELPRLHAVEILLRENAPTLTA
jgi:sugar/nucleoside kinase (ribokinase family)